LGIAHHISTLYFLTSLIFTPKYFYAIVPQFYMYTLASWYARCFLRGPIRFLTFFSLFTFVVLLLL